MLFRFRLGPLRQLSLLDATRLSRSELFFYGSINLIDQFYFSQTFQAYVQFLFIIRFHVSIDVSERTARRIFLFSFLFYLLYKKCIGEIIDFCILENQKCKLYVLFTTSEFIFSKFCHRSYSLYNERSSCSMKTFCSAHYDLITFNWLLLYVRDRDR